MPNNALIYNLLNPISETILLKIGLSTFKTKGAELKLVAFLCHPKLREYYDFILHSRHTYICTYLICCQE